MLTNIHISRSISRLLQKFYGVVLSTCLLLSPLLFSPSLSYADSKNKFITISSGFITGDFGGQDRTSLFFIAPEIGYITSNYDINMTIPYLFLSSDNDDDGQNGMMNTINGIGDIILRFGGNLFRGSSDSFSIYGSLSAKIPTASEEDSLGTGEADFGVFLDIGKKIGPIKISLLPGYIYTGDSSEQEYNDIQSYGIGASVGSGGTYYYLSYEWRTSVFSQIEDPQFIEGGFIHALNARYSLQCDASVGLNNGAPDFGIKLGLSTWF